MKIKGHDMTPSKGEHIAGQHYKRGRRTPMGTRESTFSRLTVTFDDRRQHRHTTIGLTLSGGHSGGASGFGLGIKMGSGGSGFGFRMNVGFGPGGGSRRGGFSVPGPGEDARRSSKSRSPKPPTDWQTFSKSQSWSGGFGGGRLHLGETRAFAQSSRGDKAFSWTKSASFQKGGATFTRTESRSFGVDRSGKVQGMMKSFAMHSAEGGMRRSMSASFMTSKSGASAFKFNLSQSSGAKGGPGIGLSVSIKGGGAQGGPPFKSLSIGIGGSRAGRSGPLRLPKMPSLGGGFRPAFKALPAPKKK